MQNWDSALINDTGLGLSHDQVTRMLANLDCTSKSLWKIVKPLVRQYQSQDACLIFDDSIIHKPYTDENDINYYYNYCPGRNVKGMNILTTFCHTQSGEQVLRVPIAFDIIRKPEFSCDIESKKVKCKSHVTKNELMHAQTTQAIKNSVLFSYVLADSWFSSSENHEIYL